jgi:hypothetical protein
MAVRKKEIQDLFNKALEYITLYCTQMHSRTFDGLKLLERTVAEFEAIARQVNNMGEMLEEDQVRYIANGLVEPLKKTLQPVDTLINSLQNNILNIVPAQCFEKDKQAEKEGQCLPKDKHEANISHMGKKLQKVWQERTKFPKKDASDKQEKTDKAEPEKSGTKSFN